MLNRPDSYCNQLLSMFRQVTFSLDTRSTVDLHVQCDHISLLTMGRVAFTPKFSPLIFITCLLLLLKNK